MFRSQSMQTSLTQVDRWARKVTYLEVKGSGALGLPPNDDSDPSGE